MTVVTHAICEEAVQQVRLEAGKIYCQCGLFRLHLRHGPAHLILMVIGIGIMQRKLLMLQTYALIHHHD